MKKTKITNDNFNIEIIEDEKLITKNASVDIFNNIDMNTNFSIGTFEGYFSYIKNELGKSDDESCKIVLSSNLCLSKKIPLYDVTHKNELDLSCGVEDIKNICNKLIKSDIVTTFYCDNDTDVITACLFYFVSKGYILKNCPNCHQWFLEKKAKVKYCSRTNEKNMTCLQQHNSAKEMERRESNPIVALDKKIRDRLSNRATNDIEQYIIEYERTREKYNDKELKKWLEEKDNYYLIRKKGGNK